MWIIFLLLQVRICREKATSHVYAMKKLKKSEMLRRGQVYILPSLTEIILRLLFIVQFANLHLNLFRLNMWKLRGIYLQRLIAIASSSSTVLSKMRSIYISLWNIYLVEIWWLYWCAKIHWQRMKPGFMLGKRS